jgi:F420-dependent oxidoreductase-like protein
MAVTTTPVKFGAFVPQGWRLDLTEIDDPVEQYETMTRVGQQAENLGYDSIWVFDHFHTVPRPELETTFECWSITAGLLRDTSTINVGQMVGCNGYRHPAVYAKIASTCDVMGNGRLYAGLGAGWYEHEWKAYFGHFPETRERMGAFREACEIIVRMWTEDYPKFEGKYYTIDGPINVPKGVRKPHPSFWLGGGGEKVTLRLVAKWADACNVSSDPETLRHKLEVLKGHCDAVGRNYDEIIKSTSLTIHLVENEAQAEQETAQARGEQSYQEYAKNTIVGTPETVVGRIQPLIDIGANYFILSFPRIAYDQSMLERFAKEVMPQFETSQPIVAAR